VKLNINIGNLMVESLANQVENRLTFDSLVDEVTFTNDYRKIMILLTGGKRKYRRGWEIFRLSKWRDRGYKIKVVELLYQRFARGWSSWFLEK